MTAANPDILSHLSAELGACLYHMYLHTHTHKEMEKREYTEKKIVLVFV